MEPVTLLQLLGSLGIGAIGVAIIGAFKDRSALKHAKPRADVAALSDSLNAQGETVRRLTEENTRLSTRVNTQGNRIDELETRYDVLEKACDERERLFQVAIRFINYLIARMPESVVITIPVALHEHLEMPDAKELNP